MTPSPPTDLPPERQGVPPLRPGRRSSTTRASTSGRSGTSRISILGLARSAARVRRCRPSIYRKLYLAGYRGLNDAGHRGDTVLLGELMPRGGTSPRRCARSSSCARWPAWTATTTRSAARAAKKRGCRKVGRFPTSGIAYHPYTPPAGPHAAEGRDDAAIGQLVAPARDDRRARAARQAAAAPADLDHRVRLPDQAARPVPGRVR